jgi:hypothetical protein
MVVVSHLFSILSLILMEATIHMYRRLPCIGLSISRQPLGQAKGENDMNEQSKKMELLGAVPIPKALLALGLPTMIGMLINALYNLADTYFVGGLGHLQHSYQCTG